MKEPKTHTSLFGIIFYNLLGTIALVLLTTLSFWVTKQAANAIEHLTKEEWLVYLGGGLVSSSCFVIIILLFSYTIKIPITNLLKVSALDIHNAICRLKYVFYGEGKPTKNEDAISGILTDAEHILNEKKHTKNIDKIVLGGKYEELQSKFLEKAKIQNIDSIDLYIVGTMLGTFCKDSTGLATQMVSLSSNNSNKIPFNNAYFCAPGHRCDRGQQDLTDNFKGPHRRSLYPFSSRVAAGDTLIELCKYWYKADYPLKRDLSIHLTFVEKRDIFPAIQLWGEQAAMILCSTGTADRKNENENEQLSTAITRAMPVALMLTNKPYKLSGKENEETEFSLSQTLIRLKQHIRWDYNIEKNNSIEEWVLRSFDSNVKPRFLIKNYTPLQEEIEFLELVDSSTLYGRRNLNTIKKNLERLADSDKKPLDLSEFEKIINTIKDVTYSLSGEKLNTVK